MLSSSKKFSKLGTCPQSIFGPEKKDGNVAHTAWKYFHLDVVCAGGLLDADTLVGWESCWDLWVHLLQQFCSYFETTAWLSTFPAVSSCDIEISFVKSTSSLKSPVPEDLWRPQRLVDWETPAQICSTLSLSFIPHKNPVHNSFWFLFSIPIPPCYCCYCWPG